MKNYKLIFEHLKFLTDCYKVIDSQGLQVIVSRKGLQSVLMQRRLTELAVFQNSLMITLLLDKAYEFRNLKCVVADYSFCC